MSLPSGDHCGAVSHDVPPVSAIQELCGDRVSFRYGAIMIWERPESILATNAMKRSSGENRACIRPYLECCRIWMRSCESSFSRLMVSSFSGDMKSISTFLLSLDQSETVCPQSSQRTSTATPPEC